MPPAGRISRAGLLAATMLVAACGGRQFLAPVIFGADEPTAAPSATTVPLPLAKPGADPASLGGEVVVAPGDTIYAIARRHNVSMRGLIAANGLAPPYTLLVGQTLGLPTEFLHEVVAGETLSGIANRYRVSTRSLALANDLDDPFVVTVGQRLKVPFTSEAPPAVPAEPVEAEPVEAEPVTSGSVEVAAAPAPVPASAEPAPAPEPAVVAPPVLAAVPQPAPRSEALFAWPVKGKILSTFGPKPGGLNNDGINIATPSGTPVLAAENGVVVYAGNEIPGFGNLVLIRHADGWATAYAHNSRLLVGRDDRVARGQPIAEAGATGSVTTPQVHFEVRKGNDPVDPMKVLAAN